MLQRVVTAEEWARLKRVSRARIAYTVRVRASASRDAQDDRDGDRSGADTSQRYS